MKKSKLSLCLASSFVAALSLVACNSVSSKEGAVVTITDNNGDTVEVLTDAAYRKYKTETDGVSKFYNAILETLIRYEYANTNTAIKNWTKAIKGSSEIKSEAENNVKNDKITAEENAKTNDTSYDTEWEAILTSHNCEDEDELLEYYTYQLEKEDITDKFFLQQKDSTLLTEWIGLKDDGTSAEGSAKGTFPYHIRHILNSISGGSNNFYSGTITSAEAKKLGNTVGELLKLSTEYTFADVARNRNYSDDTGSGDLGGDVGIMSTTTGFVNEFKLGIYAYDAIYTHKTDAAKDTIKKGLGIDNNYKLDLFDVEGGVGIEDAWANDANSINNGEIQEVPFDAFLKIGELAETEKDNYGKQVNKGNEHYFPRNVLYNYYLNFHNPFVITKEVLKDDTGFPTTYTGSDYAGRFATVSLPQGDRDVLVDEQGNVIIGCRSEHGIHFMIMERSIYDYSKKADTVEGASLSEYYTSLTPSDTDYPKTTDGKKKDTYVSYIQTVTDTTYVSRANTVKTAVKSFDSTYDYRLFEYILKVEGDNISIKDPELKTAISEYISRTRENNLDNAYKTLNEAWRSYTELVALQYSNRTVWDEGTEIAPAAFRTIHPRCAIGFKSHSGTAWGNNGVCYYEE